MTSEMAGFPFFPIEFTKTGEPFRPDEGKAVLDAVRTGGFDELIVLAHGWNNDKDEAKELFEALLGSMRDLIDEGAVAPIAGRGIGVVGVFWPSKKFTDDDLIPGGGASLGGDAPDALLIDRLDQLKGVFDGDDRALDEAKALVPELEADPDARRRFVNHVRSLLPPPQDTLDDASDRFFAADGDRMLQLLEAPPRRPRPRPGGAGGGVAGGAGIGDGSPPSGVGGAAGLGDFFRGIKAAARRLLNFATYYQMKERAGRVGAGGVHDLLRQIRDGRPGQRIHLVGHSFGGRLVTAAAMGPKGSPSIGPTSMTLLQAAFSHNGFAEDFDDDRDGFFREVVTARKVDGPILITHTRNDRAVGVAYPIASRIARQDAADLGDEDDVFGGIGRNGALTRVTPEAVAAELLAVGGSYAFEPGRLYNLEASAFIPDHGTVWRRQPAYAILSAIAS
jgi:hypothetical protein